MSFRTDPGTKYVRIEVLKDGAVFKVMGGPEKADGFTWWRLQDEGGTIGWGVEDFLEPTGG
ncbi:MAG: SH3 domain-containing protein [Planctomycetaceae bacterium]|nr:SH3 domain-containing protein [Planctomycetaceae bacterium]